MPSNTFNSEGEAKETPRETGRRRQRQPSLCPLPLSAKSSSQCTIPPPCCQLFRGALVFLRSMGGGERCNTGMAIEGGSCAVRMDCCIASISTSSLTGDALCSKASHSPAMLHDSNARIFFAVVALFCLLATKWQHGAVSQSKFLCVISFSPVLFSSSYFPLHSSIFIALYALLYIYSYYPTSHQKKNQSHVYPLPKKKYREQKNKKKGPVRIHCLQMFLSLQIWSDFSLFLRVLTFENPPIIASA